MAGLRGLGSTFPAVRQSCLPVVNYVILLLFFSCQGKFNICRSRRQETRNGKESHTNETDKFQGKYYIFKLINPNNVYQTTSHGSFKYLLV